MIFHDNAPRMALLVSGCDESGADAGFRLTLRTFIAHQFRLHGQNAAGLDRVMEGELRCLDRLKTKEDKQRGRKQPVVGFLSAPAAINDLIFLLHVTSRA